MPSFESLSTSLHGFFPGSTVVSTGSLKFAVVVSSGDLTSDGGARGFVSLVFVSAGLLTGFLQNASKIL